MKAKKRGPKPKKIDLSKFDELKIPFSVFRNTKLTVYESLVIYLKDNNSLNFRQISRLLDRDERNIWTVYQRAKKKNEKKK